jgi:hypothetical protein
MTSCWNSIATGSLQVCYILCVFTCAGDEQEERSFHRYKRRSDAGGPGFNSADDVYQFNATRTIFVGNIERNTNSAELKRMFERYGEIVVSIYNYIYLLDSFIVLNCSP